MLPEIDYNVEAKKLWERLGETRSFYNNLDPVHKSEAGGYVYVGSDTAARDLKSLQTRGVTGVVNCTTNINCYHRGVLEYLTFDIAGWRRHTGDNAQSLPQFLSPVMEFIQKRIEAGESVLVHCLAGAHRAGTTACISLMHLEGLNSNDAVREAKSRRPIIEPIGDFRTLLARCDELPRDSNSRGFQLP